MTYIHNIERPEIRKFWILLIRKMRIIDLWWHITANDDGDDDEYR